MKPPSVRNCRSEVLKIMGRPILGGATLSLAVSQFGTEKALGAMQQDPEIKDAVKR